MSSSLQRLKAFASLSYLHRLLSSVLLSLAVRRLRFVVLTLLVLSALIAPAAQAQTEIVLHSFPNSNGDGTSPEAGLIMDLSGNLYGTTYSGGSGTNCTIATSGCGTAFELIKNADGSYTEEVLHSFGSYAGDGANPRGALVMDSSGNLFGTTQAGGSDPTNSCGRGATGPGHGTVFQLVPKGDGSYTEKILYSFTCGVVGTFPTGAIPAALSS